KDSRRKKTGRTFVRPAVSLAYFRSGQIAGDELRNDRSADFSREATLARGEEEQQAADLAVGVISQIRKALDIPARVLDLHRDLLRLARSDRRRIDRKAAIRQQIVGEV